MYITNISKDNSGSFSLNSQNENAKNNYIIPNTNHNLILPNHLKHILDNFNKESKAMQLNDNSLQEKNNKPSIFQSILSLKKANTHRVTKSIPRNEFSFQPTLIKSKLFKTNSFSKHNFLQRQEEYSKKLANKKEKMTEEHFNYVTNNLNNKHTKKISLNEFVEHCDRNLAKHNQLKETLMSKYYPDSGWNVMDNQNPNSLRILLEVYKKTFEKLFQILDFDEDGLISPFTISKSIKSLDKNIQKIISPITSELIEENYTLSKNEFVSALFELNKDLTLEQKNALLNFYYKVSKKEESIKKNKNDNNFSHLTFKVSNIKFKH